jgi:pseudaminic acid synthase
MNNMQIKINNSEIGLNKPPYIIAEMSGNHNQELDEALKIVHAAKLSGANAIKLQTYKPETLTIDVKEKDFLVSDPDNLWTGMYLFDLYNKAFTPWEWHKPIFEEARKIGLDCFSSAFDETSVDYLEDLNTPAYKIASFENSHLPLIAKVAQTKKPLIISTGMASLYEISEAVEVARDNGCKQLILLKCTSEYPANYNSLNLKTIVDLRKMFKCEVGYSDHSLGIGASIASIALGATVIEKHFKIEEMHSSVDSAFSSDKHEFEKLVIECNRAWQSIGTVFYGPTNGEVESIKFRRSIYAIQDIEEGEILTTGNIRIIRPGYGIHPRYFLKILGNKSPKSMKKGERVDEDFIR